MDHTAILEMRNITKKFGSVKVLDSVDFTVEKGEVHALVGANGAGKSTLMKILNGIYTATEGDILLDGQKVVFSNPRDAFNNGVSMIHQELDLVTNLDVSENIYLGRELKKGARIDRPRMRAQAQELLDSLGFDIDAKEVVGNLSTAKQQLVLVARIVSLDSSLIVMDEPTSSLSVTETEALFYVIRQLKGAGISIIYISHYLEEIFTVADKVTVLRNGCKVVTESISDCTQEQLVEWMVGKQVEHHQNTGRDFNGKREILTVSGLTQKNGYVHDISFCLREGEIIGLAGVVGSGRTELLKMIFGAEEKRSGEIKIDGKPLDINEPKKAVALNIGFVPEDRKTEGLALGRSIGDNIALPELGERSHHGIIDQKSVRSFIHQIIRDLHVKCETPGQEVLNLSGGNQQKVVIGKWLSGKFKIIFFDQPTRGVDVGSKSEIYQVIRRLAEEKVSMIVASDEIEELLDLCDRILVMKKGEIVHEFTNNEIHLTKTDILSKMVN